MTSLDQLLSVEIEKRDEAWEKSFFQMFVESKVNLLSTEPKEGPDFWPYLLVSTDATGDEPSMSILNWLSTRGIGLAVNPQKPTPDFVFTYGMIWNFRERGEFISAAPERKSGSFEIKHGQELMTGAPSESYLPGYARKVLKQFLADQGILAPKVLMVSFDKVNYDLCLSIESLKSPPEKEHSGIAEAISWFLPSHYYVSLISEKAVPGFQLL